jgi:hypothetical protein
MKPGQVWLAISQHLESRSDGMNVSEVPHLFEIKDLLIAHSLCRFNGPSEIEKSFTG